MQFLILGAFVISSKLNLALAMESKCSTMDEIDDSTLMQLNSQIGAVPSGMLNVAEHIHSGSPERMSLFGMRRYVESLAERVADQNYRVSPTESEALQTIKQYISNMSANALITHDEDQAELNAARDLIQGCADDTANLLSGAVYNLGQTLEAYRQAHASCRTDEGVTYDAMRLVCSPYEQYIQIEANRIPPVCVTQLDNSFVDVTNPMQRSQMEACFESVHTWLMPLLDQSRLCNNKSDIHSSQTAECNTKQSTLEHGSCAYAAKLDDTCDTQIRCRTSTIEARNNTHSRLKTSETSRKAGYSAGKHALCYFRVFEASKTDMDQIFKECKSLSVDTSKFDLSYPEVPAEKTCEPESVRTCDSAWLHREYSTQAWFAKASMATCQQCPTPLSKSQNICLSGKDIKDGTGQDLQGSGDAAGSDEECNQRCQNTQGCTAWIREANGEKCWLHGGAVEWEDDADRNAGLPGCTNP